jgi:hypothetical protein
MLHFLHAVVLFAGLEAGVDPSSAEVGRALGRSRTIGQAVLIAAERADAPWWLVAGLCWRESRCTARVRSRRTGKSWGLFQLRVSATNLERWQGREEELLSPRVNARVAGRFLRMWKRYHRKRCFDLRVRRGSRGRGSRGTPSHPWWSHWQWGVRVGDTASARRVYKAGLRFLFKAVASRARQPRL